MPHFTATRGVVHVYADGTHGDDKKSGKTPASAKKSLQAVIDLVPYFVNHNVCIHLKGIFEESETVTVERFVSQGHLLLVDGGEDTTAVAKYPPWVGASAGTSAVTSPGSTTPWAKDALVGYWVEILSGPAKGQTRMIQANDSHSITPVQNFNDSSPAGTNFCIARPSTEVTKATVILRNLGNGCLHLQNLTASQPPPKPPSKTSPEASAIWMQNSPGLVKLLARCRFE